MTDQHDAREGGDPTLDAMVEALKPFAAVAEHDIGSDESDLDYFQPAAGHNRAPRLTVGDLRRASAILARIGHPVDKRGDGAVPAEPDWVEYQPGRWAYSDSDRLAAAPTPSAPATVSLSREYIMNTMTAEVSSPFWKDGRRTPENGCRSSVEPCSWQRTSPYTLCPTCSGAPTPSAPVGLVNLRPHLRMFIDATRSQSHGHVDSPSSSWWLSNPFSHAKWKAAVDALEATLSDQTGGAVPAGDLRPGLEEAIRYHEAKARKWRREAERHVRPSGQSDCERRDLSRAERHEKDAAALRARLAEQPSGGPVAAGAAGHTGDDWYDHNPEIHEAIVELCSWAGACGVRYGASSYIRIPATFEEAGEWESARILKLRTAIDRNRPALTTSADSHGRSTSAPDAGEG